MHFSDDPFQTSSVHLPIFKTVSMPQNHSVRDHRRTGNPQITNRVAAIVQPSLQPQSTAHDGTSKKSSALEVGFGFTSHVNDTKAKSPVYLRLTNQQEITKDSLAGPASPTLEHVLKLRHKNQRRDDQQAKTAGETGTADKKSKEPRSDAVPLLHQVRSPDAEWSKPMCAAAKAIKSASANTSLGTSEKRVIALTEMDVFPEMESASPEARQSGPKVAVPRSLGANSQAVQDMDAGRCKESVVSTASEEFEQVEVPSEGESEPNGERKWYAGFGRSTSFFHLMTSVRRANVISSRVFHITLDAYTNGHVSQHATSLTMSNSAPLTAAQTHALFDILIHHQLYSEIEAFKYPSTINQYGYPFRKPEGSQTTSPLLQNMLNKFALTNPALRHLGQDFWQDKVGVLMGKLAEAELSESYDKGAIGSRKALATAGSSIAEYVARGMLGGYPVTKGQDGSKEYDMNRPEDVQRGFDDLMHGVIYGTLLEEMFEKVKQTGKLEHHPGVVQAGHEYMLLNAASFLHHVFVMSPDGQYLVRVVENAHKLIPYMVIKQTLRVGNAATMINGMVRLVLAKISVTAMTNWIGLTNSSNDGMNLLQQIISTVLAWDTAEFSKRAAKLESARDAPDKKVFKAIKSYVYASREKHEAARYKSIQESKSIVAVILESAETAVEVDSLSEGQHTIAMEYFSTYLSIRDREELTKISCKLQPDTMTAMVRQIVTAMDPIIRAIHNAVDLSGTIHDTESFLTDLVRVSKPRKKGSRSRQASRESSPARATPASMADQEGSEVPTVEDYVQLLRRHAPSMHKFAHQVTKNAPDLANDYLQYAKRIFSEFKVDEHARAAEERGEGGAGNMTAPLHAMFSSLPKEKQDELKTLLDEHERHLGELKNTSLSRLQSIMQPCSGQSKRSGGGTRHGPGMYLSRWNSLLDSTLLSPASAQGEVRRGWQVKGELDGKGFKTCALLDKKGNKNAWANGTGDGGERRRREAAEEEKMTKIWEGMRDGWVGVCRGLEVMGAE
ncbi:hypothetical protein ACEQ8H_005415 [Pleosporales sp. CAS-2024a]